jgi:tail collar domain
MAFLWPKEGDMRTPRDLRRWRLLVALAVGGALFTIASVVQADIPDGGTIHSCYAKDGSLRVIDTSAGQSCNTKKETQLDWAQNGQRGAAGPTGQTGAPGSTGPTGPKGATGAAGSDPTADAFVAKFGTNTNQAAAGRGTECMLGEIMLTAGTVANGIPANGQLLSIAQNTALFSLLGTTYGGNGQTTFALPDLRGLAPNNMTYSICDEGIYPSRR